MESYSPRNINLLSITLIASSIFTTCYWWIGISTDVYHFAITGAIYEILWLPMLVAIPGLMIASFIFLVKDKFKLRSLFYYPILILSISLFIFYSK